MPQPPDPLSEFATATDDSDVSQEELEKRYQLSTLGAMIQNRFQEAKDDKEQTERIHLDSYFAWRGKYNSEQQARINDARERNEQASDLFIKITKTKVQAVYGQILEVLLSGSKFPVGIEATPMPDGVAEEAHILPEALAEGIDQLEQENGPIDPYGYDGDGQEIEPGATKQTLLQGLYGNLGKYLTGKSVKEGPSPDRSQVIEVHPADRAAEKMEKVIQDQLGEVNAIQAFKRAAFESVLYGTGVIKGPFNETETIHKWERDEETGEVIYKPEYKLRPVIEQVSTWDFYPDPEARCADEWEWVIQRHLLSRTQIRKLLSLGKDKNSSFDTKAITRILDSAPQYEREDWETSIQDNSLDVSTTRYEVLEYWGYIDSDVAEALGIEVESTPLDIVQMNVWVCNGEVIRLNVNPFTPTRIPYMAFPYEEHPHQIWGIGVPENMDDTQKLMNGHMRMAVDNLRLAGSLVFEVNENHLAPGQDMSIYPGKIFRTQAGPPGQSVFGITFPNVSQSHILMYDTARRLADEEVGVPSFSHGITGVQGTHRSSSGLSMLMGSSAVNIKTVIRNIDHYLLEPLGNSLFQWNMQFNNENAEIRGDLKVVSRGTSSLMQKEVLTQRLLSLIQVASNPLMAPFFNAEYAFRELAKNMDLDPDKIVNDPKIAAMYAELIQQVGSINVNAQTGNGQEGQNPNQPGGGGGAQARTGGVNPQDTTGTGGGNIGVGAIPSPGESGFTG